jgi:quinol monooxygenase YgiN
MSLFGNEHEIKKVSVVAQIRAKSGHEDEVRRAMAGLPAASMKEPGCLSYKVFEDAHYTGSFFTEEEWESEAALDEHLRLNKAILDKTKGLLREDLRISVLKELA